MLRPKPPWLQALFPWEHKALRVNGRTMTYLDEGPHEARPVLLLHGNPTWGFVYRDFLQPLTAAGYRTIVPDWVGAGYSDHPRLDAALTLAHHIADLVALIDHLQLRGFVIVGHDWGGTAGGRRCAATRGAARRPHSDEHLAVYGSCWPLSYLSPPVDHLACATYWPVFYEASQGAIATRAVRHQPS